MTCYLVTMRKTMLVLGAAALLATVWISRGDDAPPDAAADKVTWHNRLWIDRLPGTERDKIDVLVAIEEPQIGIFQNTSAYEGDFSLFAWEAKRDGVGIEMLQSRKRHALRFEIDTTRRGAFDYALKVYGAPRGAQVYYSMADWVVEGDLVDDREALADWVEGRLAELQ